MSLSMRTAVGALSLINRMTSDGSRNAVQTITHNAKPAELPATMYDRYGAYYRQVDDSRVVFLDPENEKCANVLVYIHGGEYKRPLTMMHWGIIDRLMKETCASALVPMYQLAPHHSAKDAYSLLDGAFAHALKSARETGGKIIVAGDCAGGGLAQAYVMSRRDRGLVLPDNVLLFYPWLDLTLSNPEIHGIKDPVLNRPSLIEAGRRWSGSWGVRDPRVSPIFGSVENLPKTHIYQGKRDIMYPDVRNFANLAVGAGSPVSLTLAPRAFHGYMGARLMPEARAAYREIGKQFAA